MAVLAFKEHRVDTSVSDEARQRIDDARLRDIAFYIRRRVGVDSIAPDDARLLALIVVQGLDKNEHVDRLYVAEKLVGLGRSKQKADALSAVLFK